MMVYVQASAPAQAPVAAKTKEEAIAMSKNVSSQQQAPQADRKPAPPKKAPAPVDTKEAERRREAGRHSRVRCDWGQPDRIVQNALAGN